MVSGLDRPASLTLEAQSYVVLSVESATINGVEYWQIAVPWRWIALALTALSLAAAVPGASRVWRHRREQGHCPICGYDLRASKERCPECGEAIAATPAECPETPK